MRVIRIIFVVFVLFTTICATAQTSTKQEKGVTTFLGIPVDGTKQAMIQKLKNKGFTYDAKADVLKGEFNGRDVKISVVTNKNKVYRIVVNDANYTIDESQIKKRFNNLCEQFKNNPKYIYYGDFTIAEDEDILYEMTANHKSYEGYVVQISKEYLVDLGLKVANGEIKQEGNKYIDTKTGKKIDLEEIAMNKVVWFTISDDFGKYGITIYYENGYNKSKGEDL